MSSRPLVLYHGSCSDGFTAAWVVRRKYPDGDFRPMAYQSSPIPNDIDVRDVIMVDFSWRRSEMEEVARRANTLLVLDHHASAQRELTGVAGEIIFDMEKSGARMAWDYFFPDVHLPDLVAYVEDRDLWRKVLPHSDEVNTTINSYPFTWEAWNRLNLMSVDEMVREGRPILRYQKILVDAAVERSYYRTLGLMSARVACSSDLQSEIGNALASPEHIAVVWYQDGNDKYRYSLRSVKGGVDVGMLASTYGGGGHPNAAGITSERWLLE